MKRAKLTMSDLSLIQHAIDIIHSDYNQEISSSYGFKMQSKLEKLSAKLSKLAAEQERIDAKNKKRIEAEKKIKAMLKAFRGMK